MESSCYVALRWMTRSRRRSRRRRRRKRRRRKRRRRTRTGAVVDIGSFAARRGKGRPASGRHIPHNQVADTRCDKVSPRSRYVHIYACVRVFRMCSGSAEQSSTLLRYVCMPIRATTPFVKATLKFCTATSNPTTHACIYVSLIFFLSGKSWSPLY